MTAIVDHFDCRCSTTTTTPAPPPPLWKFTCGGCGTRYEINMGADAAVNHVAHLLDWLERPGHFPPTSVAAAIRALAGNDRSNQEDR